MPYIIGGLVLVAIYALIAFLLSIGQDVTSYTDINIACRIVGALPNECNSQAVHIGFLTTISTIIVLLVTPFLVRSVEYRPQNNIRRQQNIKINIFSMSPTFHALIATVIIILICHFIWNASGPVFLSRSHKISYESLFISIESLIWPLLIQIMHTEKNNNYRWVIMALLLVFTVLTPYRSLAFIFILFGMGLPIIELGINFLKRKPVFIKENTFWLAGGVISLVLMAAMYMDTRNRTTYIDIIQSISSTKTTSDENYIKTPSATFSHQKNTERGKGEKEKTVPSPSFTKKIIQRVTHPLYQGYFADRIVSFHDFPSPINEFMARFHLSNSKTHNQYLYDMIYGGYGGTTSLYYGEGVVNMRSSPFYWSIAFPLLMVIVFSLFQRAGIETGTLFGIAIWRGFMGGGFNILPSLMVQLLCLFIFYKIVTKEGSVQ